MERSEDLLSHFIEWEVINEQKIFKITEDKIENEVAFWATSLEGYLGPMLKVLVIKEVYRKTMGICGSS